MAQQKLKVYLTPCQEYDSLKIASFINDVASHSNHFFNLRGAKVLLKPNLISSRGLALSCSHPQFIAGAAIWFREQGAKVVLGDSPAFGTAHSVCQNRGIAKAIDGLGVEIIHFKTPIEKELACGRRVDVAAEALDCDHLVGLPRIKAHNQMFLTLATKNLFGIVKGINKGILHMTCGNSYENFSRIILGLVELLPSQFHFIDGIEVMSESGPMDGTPLHLGCLGASASPVALDRAIVDLLEVDESRCPLVAMASKLQLRGAEITDIEFPLSHSLQFYGAGFIPPEDLNPIRFNPFRFFSGMLRRLGLQLSGEKV